MGLSFFNANNEVAHAYLKAGQAGWPMETQAVMPEPLPQIVATNFGPARQEQPANVSNAPFAQSLTLSTFTTHTERSGTPSYFASQFFPKSREVPEARPLNANEMKALNPSNNPALTIGLNAAASTPLGYTLLQELLAKGIPLEVRQHPEYDYNFYNAETGSIWIHPDTAANAFNGFAGKEDITTAVVNEVFHALLEGNKDSYSVEEDVASTFISLAVSNQLRGLPTDSLEQIVRGPWLGGLKGYYETYYSGFNNKLAWQPTQLHDTLRGQPASALAYAQQQGWLPLGNTEPYLQQIGQVFRLS